MGWSGGLATPEPAASKARRPALTAPARDAIDALRAGTKERPLARTKELSGASDDVTLSTVSSRGLREDDTRWRFGLPSACEHW